MKCLATVGKALRKAESREAKAKRVAEKLRESIRRLLSKPSKAKPSKASKSKASKKPSKAKPSKASKSKASKSKSKKWSMKQLQAAGRYSRLYRSSAASPAELRQARQELTGRGIRVVGSRVSKKGDKVPAYALA